MTAITGLIILGCWIIFILYWMISAFRQKPMAEGQSVASALAHRIPVGLGWFLLIFPRLPPPMNRVLVPHTNWALAIGTAICGFGLFVTIWARRTLAGNWSSDVTFKQNHELVRTGPYRFVRHPIYTGLLVMALGTALNAGQLRCWLSIVVVGIGFWIKLKQEERLMLRHFPGQYPAYKKQVKALVPFVI
ncbi:MAG TPA: isoprenylcysteine carboxylmethyltransferase family protein [Verrucomicrobiae bacterium]|nr:isoprenylcysteine carboxylmethyltransferase family protein [Verrucomicrobiae bacterium]